MIQFLSFINDPFAKSSLFIERNHYFTGIESISDYPLNILLIIDYIFFVENKKITEDITFTKNEVTCNFIDDEISREELVGKLGNYLLQNESKKPFVNFIEPNLTQLEDLNIDDPSEDEVKLSTTDLVKKYLPKYETHIRFHSQKKVEYCPFCCLSA